MDRLYSCCLCPKTRSPQWPGAVAMLSKYYSASPLAYSSPEKAKARRRSLCHRHSSTVSHLFITRTCCFAHRYARLILVCVHAFAHTQREWHATQKESHATQLCLGCMYSMNRAVGGRRTSVEDLVLVTMWRAAASGLKPLAAARTCEHQALLCNLRTCPRVQ